MKAIILIKNNSLLGVTESGQEKPVGNSLFKNSEAWRHTRIRLTLISKFNFRDLVFKVYRRVDGLFSQCA